MNLFTHTEDVQKCSNAVSLRRIIIIDLEIDRVDR